MAKLKKPLLSLGAQGSLADTITVQRHKGDHFMRGKPIPSQPNTLHQAYQRWLYQDYTAEWKALSPAEQQTWKSLGVRHQMPGFAYFLSRRLTLLPDLLGYWKLDRHIGNLALDSSRKAIHGTITGAVPRTLAIDGSLLFDGIDDHVIFPIDQWTEADLANFTVDFFFERRRFHPSDEFMFTIEDRISIYFESTDSKLSFDVYDGVINKCKSDAIIPLNTLYHAIFDFDGSNLCMYLNDTLQASNPASGVPWIDPVSRQSAFGRKVLAPAGTYFWGLLDHIAFYNRLLERETITRHSERRYPS